MKILIIYGTGEGQTRKIARFMESQIEDRGQHASIADATEDPPSPETYDAVFIGSSIHMHKYHPAVKAYIDRHIAVINKKPSVFFSVCMAVASDIKEEHEEAEKIARDFLTQSGWSPREVWHIAGALKYTQYDYFKRLVMKMIAKKEGGSTDTSKDHEYTDWDVLASNITKFLTSLL